ncbi:MAG: OmpA family protein [Chitinophagales bacterium]|nr:OmpA family protein [Chitinophagales bacterium]MDW8427827.1 OmpA family protein [Chitinophagales bacterium]
MLGFHMADCIKLTVASACLLLGWMPAGIAQIVIDTNLTAEQLITRFLVGEGIAVRNVSFQGRQSSIGWFADADRVTGLDSGIILSTGRAADAAGLNNSPWTTTSFFPLHTRTKPKGDRDLNRVSRSVTYDVTVVEFDFIAFHNKISFTYVFGSEEYPEYVHSRYNDVFAFVLSGEKMNPVNLATLPRSLIPVTVNNVNAKNNSQFYLDNDYFKKVDLKKNLPGKEKKKDKNPYSDYYETDLKKLKRLPQQRVQQLQFDGLTTVMTATYYVVPFRKYHMKIAIGDVGDPQYDSGVFLQKHSFRSVRDPAQPRFKEYVDLSHHLDSLFGIPVTRSSRERDSLDREQAEYERFTLTNIHFDTDKAIIPDTSKDELSALATYLKRHPQFICELYGYTDNIGSRRYNQRLSEARAGAVRDFLVSQGIEANRLRIVGLNFQNPIADNRDERGRALNRRVEIVLVED